jgi:hypothetical protein
LSVVEAKSSVEAMSLAEVPWLAEATLSAAAGMSWAAEVAEAVLSALQAADSRRSFWKLLYAAASSCRCFLAGPERNPAVSALV